MSAPKPNSRLPFCLIAVFLTALRMAGPLDARGEVPRFETVARFKAAEAHQAVAVDGDHFYAITNAAIGKYDKSTGKLIKTWKADDQHQLTHMNSGVVIRGRLYCAHSNWPRQPRISTIEVWDAKTLTHVASHTIDSGRGALNWIDRRDDAWWVAIAFYKHAIDQNDPDHVNRTTLVKLDDKWRRVVAWTFPEKVLARFAPASNSGGAWGEDGRLYCTGHDHGEVYALRLPESGSVLKLDEVLPVEITGQGIAWDRHQSGILYGINRGKRQVVVSRMVPAQGKSEVLEKQTRGE